MASVQAVVLLALVCAASGARLSRSARSCSLQGEGISADITTSPTSVTSGGEWKFSGAGKVKVAHTACPVSAGDPLPPADETITNGGASDVKDVKCAGACCISYCCGTGDCFSTLQVKNSTAAKKAEVTKKSAVAKKTNICNDGVGAELQYAETSSAGGSGGMGAYQDVSGAAGSCISITGAVAVKLCGPADVHLYDTSGCPGSPTETIMEAANTNNTGAVEDCIEAKGNFVSLKYTCPAWR